MFSDEFSGQIYADDELVLDMFASVFMNTTVPAGKHRYRVVTDTQRENLFWQLSTRVKTEWGFDSDTPKGDCDVLPMLGVDYRMPLSSTNSAPAGKFTFTVAFTMPDGATTPARWSSPPCSCPGTTARPWSPARDQLRRHLVHGRRDQPGRRQGQPAGPGRRHRRADGDPGRHPRLLGAVTARP